MSRYPPPKRARGSVRGFARGSRGMGPVFSGPNSMPVSSGYQSYPDQQTYPGEYSYPGYGDEYSGQYGAGPAIPGPQAGFGTNMNSLLQQIELEQRAKEEEIKRLEDLKQSLGATGTVGGPKPAPKFTNFVDNQSYDTPPPSRGGFGNPRGGFNPRAGGFRGGRGSFPRLSTPPVYDPYSTPSRGRGGGGFAHSAPPKKISHGPFKCVYCPSGFADEVAKAQHEKSHTHPMRQSSCSICGKQFKSEIGMVQHMTASHPEAASAPEGQAFKCETCFKQFKSAAQLIQHKQAHDDGSVKEVSTASLKPVTADSDAYKYFCEACNKNFKWRMAYNAHARATHNAVINEEICRNCDSPFPTRAELLEHAKMCKWEEHNNRPQDTFQCPDCMEKFNTHNSYERHWHLTHNKDALIKCSICHKPFWDEVAKNQHENAHLPDACEKFIHKCDQCDCLFDSKFNRQNHQISDHGLQTEQRLCKYCDETFPTTKAQNDHIRTQCSKRTIKAPPSIQQYQALPAAVHQSVKQEPVGTGAPRVVRVPKDFVPGGRLAGSKRTSDDLDYSNDVGGFSQDVSYFS